MQQIADAANKQTNQEQQTEQRDTQVRTFRTVFRMTGGLFRKHIWNPIYRALTNQAAIDQSASAAAGGPMPQANVPNRIPFRNPLRRN
jgi:hypothetical protein